MVFLHIFFEKQNNLKNLLWIYKEIFSDESKWKYYSKMNVNPFNSDCETELFIASFIELSGKAQNNPLYNNIKNLEKTRIRHIVSTYFLGIYLYFNLIPIKKSIDVVMNRFKKQNPDSKIEFSFIWFLICLFHDLGYSIENNEKFKNFDDFINGKIKYFLNKSVGVPPLFEKVYKNYFNYRLNSDKNFIRKPDHGICGGIILFNELNDILLRKQKNKKSEGLLWNQKLLNIYRHASWVILSHNIFFIRTGDPEEKDYRNYSLEDLILKENESSKITLKKHSFLFLFALVDSIDPIKTFGTFENLKKVKCSLDNGKIVLETGNNNWKTDYFRKVLDLKKWLIPNIKENNNQLEIEI